MRQTHPVSETLRFLVNHKPTRSFGAPWARNLVFVLGLAVLVGWAMFSSAVLAQSGAGAIQGTVVDATGAVIPGAAIHVVNNATGVAANTKSNGVGFYQVPGLFTGTYTVTVTAPNMKTYKVSIELQVAQAALIDPVMAAGSVTEQVEVASDLIQLTTFDNGTISSTLENDRISQLPMNGRTLLALAGMTTPGLEGNGQRANGLMGEALEYVQDGAPLSNRNFGGVNPTQAQLPDPDTIQEVRMETANSGAQYATPGTGIITTKSGTNMLHGSLFETARNNAIGIAKGRQDPSDLVAPHLVRNEFGASAGGPIVIPHLYHGKGKSFWFFAYERYSLSQTQNAQFKVPTMAMRKGDFSGLVNSSQLPLQLYDPSTTVYNAAGGKNGAWPRQMFKNNQIDPSRISPVAKVMYQMTPQPTTPDNPLVTSNLTAPGPNFAVVSNITFRLDHKFNENNHTYLRYTGINQTSIAPRSSAPLGPATLAAGDIPAGVSGYNVRPVSTFSGAAGYTHVFSPTFYSETTASQMWQGQYIGDGGDTTKNYEQMLGLPNNFGEKGFPMVGSGSLILGYGGNQGFYKINQIISNLDENLTKTTGKHQLQFGGRYRHERFAYVPSQVNDKITFNGQATALEDPTSGTNYSATTRTGSSDADFFLGAASNFNINLQPPTVHYHNMEFDAYFQDNYRVTKNLTINLGLRYEAHPAIWTKYDLSVGFDLKNNALVTSKSISNYVNTGYTTQAIITNLQNIGVKFETASEAGFPSKMIRDYNFTFGPRIGFAYQPFNGKHGTVIRGAYGRYIYPIPIRSAYQNLVTSLPYTTGSTGYNQSYTAANQSPDGIANYLLRSTQSVVMGVNSANVVNTNKTDAILPGTAMWTMSPNYAPDFVTQTSFTIEQSMKGNSALRVSWLWTHGTNLDHAYYYNNHPSTYAWEMITGTAVPKGTVIGSNQYAATATGPYDQTTWGNSVWDTKNGWSNDNALQANYQRLFKHGIAYQLSYVWSRPFRLGGNVTRDSKVYTAANYVTKTLGTMTPSYGSVISSIAPPARPAGIAPYAEWHDLDKYEEYMIDSAIPQQHIRFNGIVALPFGRGKAFLGNANRLVDELVGGFQIAGNGNILSQVFQPGSHWGQMAPLRVYKQKVKVNDCRSGVCHPAYQWFNGYVAPTAISGNACATTSKVVSGLAPDYAPLSSPIGTACNPTDPAYKYFGTDSVDVTLLDGTKLQGVTFSPGPQGNNPLDKTFIRGPINYTVDLSIFKLFTITERANVRLNVDAFNALNVQGYNNPNTGDGIEAIAPNGVSSSYNTPRQVQFTLRLTF